MREFISLLISLTYFSLSYGQQHYTYLALGDSYTIGESVAKDKCWPKQLVKSLEKEGLINDQLKIIAKTGWRTDQLLAASQSELDNEKFDLVTLLIGVNNEYQGHSPASFKAEFEKCLDNAISHCKTGQAGVIVVSIPDYGNTPNGLSNQKRISIRIDAYNSICQAFCHQKSIKFCDITPISRGKNMTKLTAKDGLHPSAFQYNLWIQKIKPYALKIIR